MATAKVASARNVPAMSSPIPAKAVVPRTMATMATATLPSGRQPSNSPTKLTSTTWKTSINITTSVLAPKSRGLPSGVVPSRLSTPYCRSKPVEMARLTMAVEMTANAKMAGTRKSNGSRSPLGNTSSVPKKTSNKSGTPRVTTNDSPRRNDIRVSALVWATRAFMLSSHRLGR